MIYKRTLIIGTSCVICIFGLYALSHYKNKHEQNIFQFIGLPPSNDVQLEAVRQSRIPLKCIELPSFDVQLEAGKQNCFPPSRNKDIIMEATKRN